ncbi:MAG: tRNA lysidine(34) synthetase TilS [Balneolaceae bacterium]
MNRSESKLLIEHVRLQLETALPKRDPLLIAGVSGGPDSMALLYMLHSAGVRSVVVHCNYQLRGIDSDLDQELVEEVASMWGFEVVSLKIDMQRDEAANLQNRAREERYRIFRELIESEGGDAMVTAHHQDDQLETILQKILRGSGIPAWQGMKVWDGLLFRPLLPFTKSQILQFATVMEVPYRLDRSNEEESGYARNFLRHGWFPVMEKLFPGWRENLLKVPERSAEVQAVVREMAKRLVSDDMGISRMELLSLDKQARGPVLHELLTSIIREGELTEGAVRQLESIAELQTGGSLQIDHSTLLVRDRDQFRIQSTGSGGVAEQLLTRGQLEMRAAEWNGYRFSFGEWSGKPDQNALEIDTDRLQWPLRLRNWKKGDRIRPLGMAGHQTVADHLTHLKVNAARKEEVPIIESEGGKVAAILLGDPYLKGRIGTVSEEVKCGPKTAKVLRVEIL